MVSGLFVRIGIVAGATLSSPYRLSMPGTSIAGIDLKYKSKMELTTAAESVGYGTQCLNALAEWRYVKLQIDNLDVSIQIAGLEAEEPRPRFKR
jgi:hypothetical protein